MPPFAARLEETAGSLDSPEVAYRNDFSTALSNSRSRHLFIVNALSKKDLLHLKDAMSGTGIPLRYGLSGKDNIKVWIFQGESLLSKAGEWSYHSSYEFPQTFPFIRDVVEDWDDPRSQHTALLLNEMWFAQSHLSHEVIALRSLSDYDGDRRSKYRLAIMYEKGDHVEKDLEKAFVLLKEASDEGSREALRYLVKMFGRRYRSFSERIEEYLSSKKI